MSKMSKAIAALGVVAGLGVAALPLSSYAVAGKTATATTTAQAIVGDSIAITVADETVTMGTTVMANQEAAEGSTNITVQTNNAAGYSVNIKDSDTELALKTTDGSGTATGIPAGIPQKGKNAWGFKVSSSAEGVTVDSDVQDYVKIKTSNTEIATKSTPSANAGDVITLTFGVTVDTTIAAGTYQDVVTLTASTN